MTTWQVSSYDVWGNAEDGYEVNNVFRGGEVDIELEVKTHNPGTPHQFKSAGLTDDDIRGALEMRPTAQIETDGDDVQCYVTLSRNGYPVGELFCTSHKSLSPPQPNAPSNYN